MVTNKTEPFFNADADEVVLTKKTKKVAVNYDSVEQLKALLNEAVMALAEHIGSDWYSDAVEDEDEWPSKSLFDYYRTVKQIELDRRERLRQGALSKLSPEERDVLGV